MRPALRSFGALTTAIAACTSFGNGSDPPPEAIDSGADVTVIEGGTSDAAVAIPAAPPPGVFCNTSPTPTQCDPVTELCCQGDPYNGAPLRCAPRADAGTCFVAMGCDDGNDCKHVPGGVCCASLAEDGLRLTGADCARVADCPKRSSWIVVCDPQAPDPCPDGRECRPADQGQFAFCIGLRE